MKTQCGGEDAQLRRAEPSMALSSARLSDHIVFVLSPLATFRCAVCRSSLHPPGGLLKPLAGDALNIRRFSWQDPFQ
jgi:hypothetical protein